MLGKPPCLALAVGWLTGEGGNGGQNQGLGVDDGTQRALAQPANMQVRNSLYPLYAAGAATRGSVRGKASPGGADADGTNARHQRASVAKLRWNVEFA